MPVIPADLLAPAGPVEETLFLGEGGDAPGSELETRLTTYIAQATEEVAGIAFPLPEQADEAIAAWALYLTFNAAYLLACSRPSNENTMVPVLGQQGFSKDQRDALAKRAQSYLAQFNSLVTAANIMSGQVGTTSRQTAVIYEY